MDNCTIPLLENKKAYCKTIKEKENKGNNKEKPKWY